MENNRCFSSNSDFSGVKSIQTLLGKLSSAESGDACCRPEDLCVILQEVLKNPEGKFVQDLSEEIFQIFGGKIGAPEFGKLVKEFLEPLACPVTALLVIDMQNDFIEGSLALKSCPAQKDAKVIMPVVNNLVDKFDTVVYTMDYHPPNHISFYDNVKLRKLSENNKNIDEISVFDTVLFEGSPEIQQKLWPVHCVQNTWGSSLHGDLKIKQDSLFIHKGGNPNVDSYSAFFDNMKQSCTALHDELQKRGITFLFFCGVALDYCVACTALDALSLGYPTVIVEDGTVGTDVENIKRMKDELISHKCVFAKSAEIDAVLRGEVGRVEFAYVLLNKLKKSQLVQ